MGSFFVVFYGLFALVALINLALMRRAKVPHLRPDATSFCILIPARDEEANLARLLPALLGPGSDGMQRPKVYVFDDESTDRTAAVAAEMGAVVVRPREPLPAGWTGKNRACHELAKAAAEDSDADWILFLDADIYPDPRFVAGVEALTRCVSPNTGIISGFPRMIPGRGIQPLFLAWVGWILLATNSYGLVRLTGKGHNRFTNGQFGCWRSRVYTDLWPHEMLKHSILEDVLIGRLCAKRGIGVEVANLSALFGVKMYDTWQETLDGMSKNSHEITGSAIGSIGIACLLFVIGWGWLLAGHFLIWAAVLLALSGLFSGLTVRVKPYALPFLPIALTIGSYTMIRSMVWHKKGKVVWKGRTYT